MHQLIALAQLAGQHLGVRALGERLEEVARPREHVLHSAEAESNQRSGQYAAARRHRPEVERLLDVLLVARPAGDARRLLSGVGQQPPALLRVQAGERARRRGGTE